MVARGTATDMRRCGIRPTMLLRAMQWGCRCASWAITRWNSARGPRLALRDPGRSRLLRTRWPG